MAGRLPDVVIHAELLARNRHPDFAPAKAGNANAALSIVRDLLCEAAIDRLREVLDGRLPYIVPVAAIEVDGFNAISDAMAQEIGSRLGLQSSVGVVLQSNQVAHTRAQMAGIGSRYPRDFVGDVEAGAEYLLVDDHVGFGGTLANLRGHIEHAGAHVVGMTTMTETGGGRGIAVPPPPLSMLREKHGREFEQFWREHFGYGLDCLTKLEAGYLCRVESLDIIRARLAEAAERACRGGVSTITI